MVTGVAAKGVAFLLGFGMAFLPSFGPFAAVLFVLTARLRFRRADVLWLSSAVISAAASAVHRGWEGAAFGLFQVLGPWAVYRAFVELRDPHFDRFPRGMVVRGLFTGFAMVVLVGLGSVRLDLAYPTITQAISWGASPALFAHTTLVMAALISLIAPRGWLPIATLAIASLGVLTTGTFEASVGIIALALFLSVRSLKRGAPFAGSAFGAIGLGVAVILAFGPALGIGRIGYVVSSAVTAQPRNMIRGSEVAGSDAWDRTGVVMRVARVKLNGETYTEYDLTKRGSAGWLRLQQVVQLTPGSTYTASVWVHDDGPEQPGIQGWGQVGRGQTFSLTTTLTPQGETSRLVGPGDLIDHGIASSYGAWKRIFATFRYTGSRSPLDWYVGLAPDGRDAQGSHASFAGFQVERGGLRPYLPGPVTRGLGLEAGRLTMWRVARDGILERPWLGHGPGTFPAFYRQHEGIPASSSVEVPAHAHDLYLEVLFERGLLGFVGLVLLLFALAWAAARNRDLGLLVVVAIVLFVNVFDYTLYFGGILYPLAAVAGWRSREDSAGHPAADSLSRQFLVRIALASVDLLLAWTALSAATWLLPRVGLDIAGGPSVPDLGHYLLVLWPALAWREGLYPGYGLTEPDELQRQLLASAYAGALFFVATLVFTQNIGQEGRIVVAATMLTFLLLPLGRATAKRMLRAVGLWGRPVVIIGDGNTAENLARTLSYRSLDGLIPTAVFADDPAHGPRRGATVGGVPLIGPISGANAFARREGIHHAIVAMDPGTGPARLPKLDPLDNPFTIVQYVPDLPGLPVLGVRAASLDNLLALQVRNELASPFNRAVKRALDLTGVVVGGLLISPLLLALALAVVLDSRGPALFAHTRIGRNGRRIRVWKFRTMVADAAAQLERHLAADPALRAEWEATHKLKDDPRVTRVGGFLRRFSLDELPQLWNVLIGEMSLVGPRPIVDDEVAKYRDAFDLYTMVRPGMTGYWQISGRSDTDYDQRVELDSFYVRNWSVWLDVIVLIKTVSAVLKRDGAY